MKNLSAIRRAKGLTQTELAYLTGIGMNSLARYERGEIQPSVEIASLIAKKLGVTLDELVNDPLVKDWNLRLITSKEVTEMSISTSTLDLTGKTTSASLEMSDSGMGLTISASYDVWEDDAKFEDLISQLRKKRAAGLKLRKEDW